MESNVELWSKPESIADMKAVLIKLKNLNLEKIDKKVLKALLIGFSLIVRSYEESHIDLKEEVCEDIILDWMSVYLDIQENVALSSPRWNLFSKNVHIAVTYIIGCLINVSKVSPAFYANFLQMTLHLLSQMDERSFVKLELCSKSLISKLWTVIDKVGNFNTQMIVLNIIHLILTNFDGTNALLEVEIFPNLNATTKEKLFNLLKVNSNSVLYKKISREILNEHNSRQGQEGLVHTFFCDQFCIGDKFIFTKEKDYEKFWFDINIKPYTLTFKGMLKTKCESFHGNVDVVLRIKKLNCNKEKLNIEYEPPVSISGIEINEDEIKDIRNAYAVLSEREMKRIFRTFKANTLKLKRNQNPKRELILKNIKSPNQDVSTLLNETFKKPSLDLFESAVPKAKMHPIVFHIPSDDQKVESYDRMETTIDTTTLKKTQASFLGKRRFFKSPRPPRKIEIPWKFSFSSLPIKVNKRVSIRQTGNLKQGYQVPENYQVQYSENQNIANVMDSVSIRSQKRSYNDTIDKVEVKRYRNS